MKILLLQNNLIAKIENLFKLKNLEYLNLALNNIEKIENLEQLESLKKLDLTLNFIGQLSSVENLKNNYNLNELILTGNPCTDFDAYRDYVVGVLPQLLTLDGTAITRSDQILATRNMTVNRRKIVQLEIEHSVTRDEQKIRVQNARNIEAQENAGLDEEEINRK